MGVVGGPVNKGLAFEALSALRGLVTQKSHRPVSLPIKMALDARRGPKLAWVVVKMMVPFWIPIIIRHPILRVPKKTILLTNPHPKQSDAL